MFRTELTITPQERQLPRTARVLTVGSCFADSIGERLQLNKVNALVNPFGTVFQPLALAQLLRAAAGEEQDWQRHVVEARGRWQSYDFHSTVGADSPVDLLHLIQRKVQQVGDYLRSADAVLLTLGTAWAYRLRETGELVSNLHKLPAALFEKELLTADEIVNSLAEVHALLRRIKPDIRIVLTVSPVRHIKDTLPLNAVSKSVLRVACHYLSELLPGVSYFPAFELLNDDLRDYRFYASDMLHPSEAAEDYVWDKFARAYFDADFGRFRKEWAAVRQSLTHRPLHEGAPEHRAFLDQTAERLERMVAQGVEVRAELRDVQRQLAALPPPRPVRAPEPLPEDDGEERIDIGGEVPADGSTVAVVPLATQPERQREDRGGRGRNRRGRGRDRDHRDSRPQEEMPSDAAEAIEMVVAEEATAVPLAAVPVVAQVVESEVDAETLEEYEDAADAADGLPAKKKKRRSRGGAKRTARKHAARLAAEQLSETEETADAEVAEVPTEEVLAELAETEYAAEAPADLVEADVAATEVVAETAADAPVLELEVPEAPLVSDPTEADVTAGEATELTTTAPLAGLAATPVRKRGAGPTPKKSKVIAKSSPVKRPKRTSLFRNATPAQAGTEPVEAATLAEAPIISAPIVPEALTERPATAELVENIALAADTPTEQRPAAATAKARRGRPKKAEEAPTPVAVQEATPATPVEAVAPNAAPRAPEALAAPVKRPARTPKARAVAPKAEAASTRRGRPPGRKTPPAEAPTE